MSERFSPIAALPTLLNRDNVVPAPASAAWPVWQNPHTAPRETQRTAQETRCSAPRPCVQSMLELSRPEDQVQWSQAEMPQLRRRFESLHLCCQSQGSLEDVGHVAILFMSALADAFSATEHNQDLLHLLQELRQSASLQQQHKIDDALAGATEDVAEPTSGLRRSPEKSPDKAPDAHVEDEDQADDPGEANVTAEVGSNEDMDNLNEDLLSNEHSRATGYIGKNSEVQWLKKLHQEADAVRPGAQGPYGPPGNSAQAHDERIDALHERQRKNPRLPMESSSCSFYLDREPLDMDMEVDPHELPPYDTAERLLKCYMQTVQSSFPILSQKTFTKQFGHYYDSVARGAPYGLPQKWQAMLNLVFAIGAVYSHLIEADWSADVKKEILSRIWWAVHSLDRILSAVTGRPSVGAEIHSSTTLPLPISANDIEEATIEAKFGRRAKWGSGTATSPSDAGSSRSAAVRPPGNASNASEASNASDVANAGTFLTAIVKLGMVSNNVLTQLYSPNLVTKSWREVQENIAQLSEDLDVWLASLPRGLDPFKDNGRDYTMQQERNILKTYYFSTKILICRPCLCRLDRRIQSQTQSSANFNHQVASQCVAAAKSIAACLPDDMSVWGKEIYKIFPWWSAVHYLMQSIAILLLEACYEAEGINILPAVKKLVRWLKELSSSNRTAERAYSITVDLLKKMASRTFKDPRTSQEIALLLSEHPSPATSDAGASDFAAQWFTGEEFFDQHLQPPQAQSQGESYMADSLADTIPTMGVFPGAADMPVSGFFFEALHTHPALANVFLTGFDQHNPLPFDEDDIYMQDVPEQE
ncbi:uncharacterized protein N0V89_002142 [Didymosphaeria variabile]|uniref:Xylanolytic transcriptional activator regulatory domain-containing protein n=1 Tax=Didymosphaeria variabile TaxID=1932322 RepID=A0A9W8XRZ4_9PLEO|nr:uncharacterized protein N0V89_002142 [Didymosphaeria variabile]KAJ4357566.1 hypothetical protein N0V89_002142 [Didymosphaeria variabile]